MDFSAFDAYVEAHAEQAIGDLCDLCAIPSVANNTAALQQAVIQVETLAKRAGLITQLVTERPDRPPIVLGEAGAGKPILMIYNHYDVQPADPLAEWHTPPFTPTRRDGHLYARGVADNKVNLVARLAATEAYRAVFGELPVHVRFVWEGEEESGGDQLRAFSQARAAWIAEADGCLWESGYRDDSGAHVLSLGVKGLLCVELRVRTAAVDAHSGQAALVPNAAWRLVEALATLRAPDGSVLIDGYADHIVPVENADRALLAALPFDESAYRARYGINGFVGDRHRIAAQEASFFAPTCTINGLVSGYTGEGTKTIVPCEARAKLDLRLVPDLTPALAFELLQAHLIRRGFGDLTVTEIDSGTMPARTSPTAAIARAAIEALQEVSKRAPIVYPLNPASGPMYELCQAHGIPAANFGCGWSGSQVHAPNENIRMADFIEGIKAFGRLLVAFPRHCQTL